MHVEDLLLGKPGAGTRSRSYWDNLDERAVAATQNRLPPPTPPGTPAEAAVLKALDRLRARVDIGSANADAEALLSEIRLQFQRRHIDDLLGGDDEDAVSHLPSYWESLVEPVVEATTRRLPPTIAS